MGGSGGGAGIEATEAWGAWGRADKALRSLEVSPAAVDLLFQLSLAGGESAWTRPAMVSFYEESGSAATAELFFAELKEIGLAARALTVERRYAPWAQTNAIGDLPSSTIDRSEPSPTPGVWFARWVGTCQRLAPTWEKARPFLLQLAEETRYLTDEEEGSARPATLGPFERLLETLIEPLPPTIPIPGAPHPPGPREADVLAGAAAAVPLGPSEWSLRGRTITFEDGAELRFLRFPRLGELRWDESPSRLILELPAEGVRVPAGVAAAVGGYLALAAPVLASEVGAFVERCRRAYGRLKEAFASELVAATLTGTTGLPGAIEG